MTINEITNCVDLMSRSTKERIELFANNKHDESNFANQLPSIIISSSTKRANENSTVTVVDELHHSSTGASISTPRHLSASSQKPSKTQIVVLNNQANSAGKRHSKMEPLPNFQTQATVQVHLDGMPLPLPHNQTRCIEGRHHDSDTLNCTEADQRSIISRPTTLASASSSLSAAKPPEFSISPAESLSLSKASSNEQMSSSVFHLPSVYKGPHSPSNLSVNFCYNSTNMALSPSFTSIHSYASGSINDLTVEAEQLERAIRHNDVKFVVRMLEQYLGKMPATEKQSQTSRRSSTQSKAERPILKPQLAFDEQATGDVPRRESGSTEERECLSLFSNAIHLAIENNAFEVTILLLKSGVDPNKSGLPPYTIDFWRRSSQTSEESNVQATQELNQLNASNLNLNLMTAGGLSASREPLLTRTSSIRTTNSPMLLSPQTGPSFFGGSQQAHHSLYFFANSSPSSINSELSSAFNSSPTRLLRLRPEMSQPERTVFCRPDGSGVSYEEEYTRDRLFTLPPIFLAVALNNSAIIRELIHFGANVNASDSHGVTPLHLCLCQEHISRACLQLLVQSGAKMRAKNRQSIAPYELVDSELTEEILYLQKFIIDDSFCQLLPSQSKNKLNQKETMMYANYKNMERHLFDANSNSSVNLSTVNAKHLITKEESLDSYSSGPNLARIFEPKTSAGTPCSEAPHQKKKVQMDPRQGKVASKDVHICLDDFSDQGLMESGSTATGTGGAGPTSLFLPSTLSNLMGHKRSFAFESATGATMKATNNLSQSTLHLSSSKESHAGNRCAHQSTSHQQQLGSISVGARLFGRRRSGDESAKNHAKNGARIAATLSRTNTQDETRATEESTVRRVESSLDCLCQMSSNVECIHLIIASLQKHLPEIISLNESQNTLWRLHSGLSRLFNRSLQAIVDNFVSSRDKIGAPSTAGGKLGSREECSQQAVLALKQEMSTQLCGLLVCALQCLKGGQTFQYSSLLIVNLIIDSFIRFEASTIPINWSKVFDFDFTQLGLGATDNAVENASKSMLNEKSEKHLSSAISAAAHIGKHFRNLRINESFNFKQNCTNKEEKVREVKQASTEGKVSIEQSVPKKVSDQSRLLSWMKTVHLSPKVNQRKQLNMINELIIGSSGKGLADESGKCNSNLASPIHGKEQSGDSAANDSPGEMKNAISVLVQDGLDLILNVLNNAITLHRRVSGSKHSCTPSKRSRQCIYHCLQILSARAILFASQSEEAQKRLTKEGPLKVLIASIDSTHDPQLICLALQVIANLSINPRNHSKLIDADMADCLMQLILPSDEWFYTNHSTKYAKFVKHQAARIMVYLGLEKRLRNKVYLFDLMEDLGVQSPQSESTEDCYITQTSCAPNAVYSAAQPTLLIGSSVEAIIIDLIKQVEDKMVNGEDSLCIDPLNDESYFTENVDTRTIKEPPAIQVDLPSGIIGDRRITNQHPNCFFYLSTLPMALQPIMILRVLQHRMFGSLSYWAWHSNAVSRASVASVGGSSIEFNRSRASSNASNLEITNAFTLKRNINLHCSNSSLSPGRIEIDRRPSVKGFYDNRLMLQNSLPLTAGNLPKGVQMSNSLSTIGQNSGSPFGNKLPVQMPLQRLSLIEQTLHHHVPSVDSPGESPTANKRFRFSSLRRNRHSLSTDSTSPTASCRNHSLDANERNEAYIKTFQRELQNLPKNESPSPLYSASHTVLTNSLVSIIREAFEQSGTPLHKRPRSCSVPRITLENFSSTLLQLPGNAMEKTQVVACSISPLITRSATSDGSCSNAPAPNSGPSPSLSPIKVASRNLNESPISFTSTVRSTSRSGSRSGSAGQVMTESSIMPNVHKAILRLLLDWVSICPNDFQHSTPRRELLDFLNRVAMMGDNYRWLVEEIRTQAEIDDKENLIEQPSSDSLINKEYRALQKLILTGELPCSKEEAAILAVIQLRIEETSPLSKENENRHIASMLPSASLRQSSIIEEKLRPICEDVKEALPIEADTPLHLAPVNMSYNSFDELEEDAAQDDELEAREKPAIISGAHCSARLAPGLKAGAIGPLGTGPGNFLAKMTTSRLCHWMSSNWASRDSNFSSIDVRECLPSMYHNTKNIVKTIKEQKRKLFHTPIYESEQQLKKLYIHTCKRLPAFGCKIFQVKELLHGKTNRRATRLLGICLERIVLLDSKTLQPAKVQQWRQGGGRSHDRLVLEFRGTKWSFVTPSHGSLRAIGTVLWEIMQDLDACFLDTLIAGERQDQYSEEGNKLKANTLEYYGFSKTMHFRDELQCLESLLHFPEEVALRLTQVEHELFYNIEPVHYIRQVTVELNSPEDRSHGDSSGRSGTGPSGHARIEKSFTVKELIERFNEVSSWITHIIISQPTHEMRKAILSCIMRVVQTCWSLGNFNSAVEILAGLKSEKLKPFWLSIEQKEEEPFLRKKLSEILLTLEEPSEEYSRAVRAALDIPHSKTVPFFGSFLRDLKTILQREPSLIVLSSEANWSQSTQHRPPTARIDSISEFNGEDNYMSRIGVGGIINIEKMYKTHQVLDNIRTFHIHAIRRRQLLCEMKCTATSNIVCLVGPDGAQTARYQLYCDHLECEFSKLEKRSIASGGQPTEEGSQQLASRPSTNSSETKPVKQEKEQLYEIDLNAYKPIQPLPRSHGISVIPLNPHSIDYHNLQAMHHGMTTIHFEEDSRSSAVVFLKLEESNSALTWCKPYWSTSLRSSGNTPQDYQLAADIEEKILPGVISKFEYKEATGIALEEGFIDLAYLKEILVGQSAADLALIARRHSLPEYLLAESPNCSIKLLFGVNLNDNRTTEFIAPLSIATVWVDGLRSVLRLIHSQKKLCDQRMLWLKEKYLQLYYENSACIGPTPAEAIRVFGGRKWTIDAMGATSHPSLQPDLLSSKVATSNSKLRKKKSTVSLSIIRDYSTRSQLSINSEPEVALNSVRSSGQSPQHSKSPSKGLSKSGGRGLGDQSQPPPPMMENVYDSQSSLSGMSASSSDQVLKGAAFDNSPIHTTQLTSHYREKFCVKRSTPTVLDSMGTCQGKSSKGVGASPRKSWSTGSKQPHTPKHKMAITHSSNMDFIEFSELFRSFLTCIRRDIKDLFEGIASKSDIHTFLEAESNYLEEKQLKQERLSSAGMKRHEAEKDLRFLGLLTRNSNAEYSEENYHKSRIFDAIARASIVTNSAGINTLKTSVLTATDFYAFINNFQCEDITVEQAKALIDLHESNPVLRKRGCLSFEGFSRYLTDKSNFAYMPELNQTVEQDMDYPLSHYYIASSHNTYLTGHQLKGESSVELYSQVLLTGCRCVELDCWDGDDGMPLIYHGHTLTSKISFKKVCETINEKAFIASPYPVILSVENHCSLQQQAKMAQIFLSIFGDKLVTKFLFDCDYFDEPNLPSPNQLKYRILIKNKKLRAPLHPSLNLKARANVGLSKASNGRTNSLVSNISTGSLNDDDDDEYDDEDEDEEVDEAMQSLDLIGDKKGDADGEQTSKKGSSSQTTSKSTKSHSQSESHHSSQDTEGGQHMVSISSPYVHSKVVRKSSSQIAPELSDLVIYCQAIKFRGLLNTSFNVSPTSSTIATPISKKISSRKAFTNAAFSSTIQASASLLPVIESNKIREELRELSTPSPTLASSMSTPGASMNKRPNSSAACYQISSINENTAKKLCRKTPLAVIAHTESQIMRAYPARMRIDSSNFNPVIFWAFGIQSVALNYQTVDPSLHINSAMFEQNGGCGYVLKANVMRDKSHLMFGRFNPWEKEFDGLHTINLSITIISGQYVCPNVNTGSPMVEVEIVGIQVDCNRQRTKIVQRNSLNPIWNDTFFFRIKFVDLAFLRLSVTDCGTNHSAAQRIIPVKCLRQGYRHLRLHSPQNQCLPLSTLFIHSQYEEEGLDIESETSSEKLKAKNKMLTKMELNRFDCKPEVTGTAPVKRRMFFLMVHGVMPEEPSTILKITQDSTVTDVITQALTKANKAHENVMDYVLLEEVSRGWEKKRINDRSSVTQRLLDPGERPLEAQSNWKGEGRFILKKMADDPSTRAWMTSIRSSSAKERAKRQDQNNTGNDEVIADWQEEHENETFLVCVYNVSQDQPYTILKASVKSLCQDIITQALLKAHRVEEPKSFVIVEEVENFSDTNQSDSTTFFKSKPGMSYRRVVGDHENIYDVQTQWKNKGKFELKYRKDVIATDNTFIKNSSPSTSKLLRGRGSFKKLSQLHRSYSRRLQKKDTVESPASTRKSGSTKSAEGPSETISSAVVAGTSDSDKKPAESDEARQAHSEGEMPSDSEEKTTKGDSVGSLTRLKKLSLKRLKVWKS